MLSEAATSILSLLPLGAGEPAGGAETGQVAIASLGAGLASASLLALAMGHRAGRIGILGRVAAVAERASGLPGWAALPAGLGAVALIVALLGMYWDISLHIDNGRDAGPLANPAHYLILAGLFGVFASGVLAIVLPTERPGPSAVRIARGWYAPAGGVLMAACGAFSLIAFPLDDVSHRLFGQDVTLWGPTHLMLIGGAGLSLVAQAVLLAEGLRARDARPRASGSPRAGRGRLRPDHVTALRRVGLMGGLLIGLSTFQAEFDFGVPQYRLVFQPMLIALAGGFALVTARIWIGRGGAIGAALFFLAIRGGVSLLVGPVFGQTTPSLALYLGEALCVEALALVLARRPLALGVAGGALIGTAGLGSEWAWSQFAMRLPWGADLLPEAIVFAVAAGVAGGLAGALLGLGLRGELPRPAIARTGIAAATATIAVLVAAGLQSDVPAGARASVTLDRAAGDPGAATATVRIGPRSLVEHPAWVTVTAWQGGGLHVDRLREVAPGVYRTHEPFPVHGSWKSLVRVHSGNAVLGAPAYMPADPAIPAAEVPAAPRFTRALQRDTEVLQRERDFDVPVWLWGSATAVVLALYLALIAALSWGVGRIGRAPRPAPSPARRAAPRVKPAPVGAR